MISSAMQRRLGKPLIALEFSREVSDQERFLSVFIKNTPINARKRLTRIFSIRRETVQSLTAQFRIIEAGSNTILIPNRQARLFSDENSDDLGRDRMMLPPTFSVGASIMVAQWDLKNSRAIVPGNRIHEEYILPPGYYCAHIILIVDGNPMSVTRNLVLGDKADDLVWANN